MSSSQSAFYKVKMKNLFTAHQNIYTSLLYDNLNDHQKTHLRKLLNLLQKNIQKLLSQNKGNNLHNVSSHFKIEKRSVLQKRKYSHVTKKNGSTKYFIRKQSNIDDCWKLIKDDISNSGDSSQWSKQVQIQIEQLHFIDKDENERENNKSMVNIETTIEPEMELIELPEETPEKNDDKCDGHGKSTEAKKDFIRNLGLVHKNDYQELIACKKSRKRRTTANPQFSHAAIEAKRITKMEIANERKHRKQLALEKQNSKLVSSDCFASKHPKSRDEFKILKSQVLVNNENELYPGLFSIVTDQNFEQTCKICSEACRFIEDTIVICRKCSSILHLNCLEQKTLLSGNVECSVCNPRTSEKISISAELSQKLTTMRQYISLLTYSNHCLKALDQKKQSEKEKLSIELDGLRVKFQRMRKIVSFFDFDVSSDDDEIVSLSCSKTNDCQSFPNFERSNSVNKESLADGSSMIDEYESDNSSVNPLDTIINSDGCEQDFPIVSSCA